jgi:hypothetical protein
MQVWRFVLERSYCLKGEGKGEWGRRTHDGDSPDEDVRGVGLGGDHLGDEVRSHPDDGDERDTLETAGDGVGRAEGAVLGSRHGWFF